MSGIWRGCWTLRPSLGPPLWNLGSRGDTLPAQMGPVQKQETCVSPGDVRLKCSPTLFSGPQNQHQLLVQPTRQVLQGIRAGAGLGPHLGHYPTVPCYGMSFCVPPNSYTEALTPSMVFGGGPSRGDSAKEVVRVGCHHGIGPLLRKGGRRSVFPCAHSEERPCEHTVRR